MNSGCRISFDVAGSWSFGNDFARNVMIFGVDNNLLSTTNNLKNCFLLLGENLLMKLMILLALQRKKIFLVILK